MKVIVVRESVTMITIGCLINIFFWQSFAVFTGLDVKPYTFSYAELRTATEDFNPSNVVGEGGFGPVFKVNILMN